MSFYLNRFILVLGCLSSGALAVCLFSPSAHDATLTATLASVAVVSWIGLLIIHCQSVILRRIARLESGILAYGEQVGTDAKLDAQRDLARAIGGDNGPGRPRPKLAPVDH